MATQAEINNMSKRDRLWYDLTQAYDDQVDQSNKSFEKAYSDASNQMLSRGMGRSSYAGQTLVNIDKSKVDAQNRLLSEKSAAYASGLRQIEQEEEEQRRWEAEFKLQQEQLAWEREQAALKVAAEAAAASSGSSYTQPTTPTVSDDDFNSDLYRLRNGRKPSAIPTNTGNIWAGLNTGSDVKAASTVVLPNGQRIQVMK